MELSSLPKQPILQPLTLGQLLDRAFRLYRRHFLQFVGIAVAAQIPAVLLQALFSSVQTNPSGVLVCLGVVVAIIAVVIGLIGQAALMRSAGMNYLGQPSSFADAYGHLRDRWLSLVGMQILLFLAALAIMVGSAVAIIVGWLSFFGMLIYFSAVIVQLSLVVFVLEVKGAGDSIGRAWDIARKRFWWILGYMFVLSILSWLVLAGPVALISAGSVALLGDDAGSQLVITILQIVADTFFTVLYIPLQTSAVVVMYIDYRVRNEGLDLALQAEEDNDVPSSIEQILQRVPESKVQGMLTWEEWVYFVGITIGLFAVYFVLAIIIASFVGLAGGF